MKTRYFQPIVRPWDTFEKLAYKPDGTKWRVHYDGTWESRSQAVDMSTALHNVRVGVWREVTGRRQHSLLLLER